VPLAELVPVTVPMPVPERVPALDPVPVSVPVLVAVMPVPVLLAVPGPVGVAILLALSLTPESMGGMPPVCPFEQARTKTGANARRSSRGVMESAFHSETISLSPSITRAISSSET
jgi:hypothetical protein